MPGVPVCRTTALLRLVGACPVHLVGPRLPYQHDLPAEGAERPKFPADPLESLGCRVPIMCHPSVQLLAEGLSVVPSQDG